VGQRALARCQPAPFKQKGTNETKMCRSEIDSFLLTPVSLDS
jgi:hypothetical protein